MYVTHVEIEDLRCFAGRHAFDLRDDQGCEAGWTVFAGRNGSGKTTLLQAITLGYLDLRLATDLNGGRRWTRPGKQSARCWVRLTKSGEEQQRRRTFMGFDAVDDPRLRAINGTGEEGLPESFTTDLKVPLFAWGASRLGPDRESPPEPHPDPIIARVEHLMRGGGPLHAAVRWLQSVHTRALEDRPGYKSLKADVLRLLNDGLLPAHSRVLDVDSDGLWVERDGVRLLLQDISEGYRAVTTLVLDLVRHLHDCYGSLDLQPDVPTCPRPGVALIDEVDAHLHVSWQQKIGFWLTKHFPQVQFLVTTHSPFVCQAARRRGLIRLPSPGDGRDVEHVSEDTWRAVVHGSVDEAVLTDLFGLEHPRSDRTEELREELGVLEARLLRGVATAADRARYAELKGVIGDSLSAAVDRNLRALRAP